MGPKDSASPYVYAAASPYDWVDPLGMCLPTPGTRASEPGAGRGTGSSQGWTNRDTLQAGIGSLYWGGVSAFVFGGPIGMVVGALMIGAGLALTIFAALSAATRDTRTDEQEAELNRAAQMTAGVTTSPGGMIGGTIGAATRHDVARSAGLGAKIEFYASLGATAASGAYSALGTTPRLRGPSPEGFGSGGPARAAGGGAELGLGLRAAPGREGFRAWARRMGFKTFDELSPKMPTDVQRIDWAMKDATKIHFNMEGFSPPARPRLGVEFGEPTGGYTNYEYSQLSQQHWDKAQFWMGSEPWYGPHQF